MKKNIELKEIGKKLFEADSVVIFPHTNPDGDAIGASVALCIALRREGITSVICSAEDAPEYIKFLKPELFIAKTVKIEEPDICVAVDCSEDSRLNKGIDVFKKGKISLCIDHHINDSGYGDFYYIDEDAAATCEIVYDMLKGIGYEISRDIATALYTGISTDTGNYLYSNTKPETHIAAAGLLELGADHNNIMVALYQNRRLKKVLCESKAMDRLMIFANEKGAMTYMSSEDFAKMDAKRVDADEIIDLIRNIAGVEIAAYLEERENGIKVSMRAKTTGNVADICIRNGGGGHMKAAGCTLKMPMEDAFALIKREIEEAL